MIIVFRFDKGRWIRFVLKLFLVFLWTVLRRLISKNFVATIWETKNESKRWIKKCLNISKELSKLREKMWILEYFN